MSAEIEEQLQTAIDAEPKTDSQPEEAVDTEPQTDSQAEAVIEEDAKPDTDVVEALEQTTGGINHKPSIYDQLREMADNVPRIFSIPDSEDQEVETKCCNLDVKMRLARWSFIAVVPLFFLMVESAAPQIPLPVLLGFCIEFMYIAYFGILAGYFYSGSRKSKNRTLFRIWTRAERVPGWAAMTIATHQQIYEYEAIQSISEFSAVDGGIPSFMLANLGTFTWTVVAMHYATELNCHDWVFQWDIADVMEIIGVLGLVMIGIFELDPYNPAMKKMHYVGALTGCGTVVGFLLQQISLTNNEDYGYSLIWLPVLIIIIAGVNFGLWQFYGTRTVKYQDEIKEKFKGKKPNPKQLEEIRAKINELSLKNVTTEGIFLFMGATSLALWLIFYHEDCDMGCAGPGAAEHYDWDTWDTDYDTSAYNEYSPTADTGSYNTPAPYYYTPEPYTTPPN